MNYYGHNAEESALMRKGAEIVEAEFFNAIAELEESTSNTSYGKGQRYILRRLVEKLTKG